MKESTHINKEIVFPEEKKNFSTRAHITKCPKCGDGDIMEHEKGFYCTKWKSGCKFTIWKSTVEPYGIKLDKKIIKELITHKKLGNINMIMPQTQEKCIGELTLKEDLSGAIEIKNMTRIS